jgi:integrase
MGKLTDLRIRKTKPLAGKRTSLKMSDGGGLYLYVAPTGAKNWVLRYVIAGRESNMGMGSYPDTSLADAREMAATYRKIKRDGIDPKKYREQEREKLRSQYASSKSFSEVAAEVIQNRRAGWKNKKHAAQWASTLRTYAFPAIGDMDVDTIEVEHIMSILSPIWDIKPETANRVRQRLEVVMDAAITLKYRTAGNPARWKGHLDNLLPKRDKVRRVVHYPALPFREAPQFMRDLERRTTIGALALQFTILTACRTSEVINAKWEEIDMDNATWVVPAERMKAGMEHRVPLSPSAVAVLKSIERQGDFVFNGLRVNRPISDATMRKLLQKDMGFGHLVVHGFRSTFRDWCAEETSHANIVAEMALAHTIKDQAEASYRRGDLFKKRAALMQDWGKYLCP